MNALVRALLGTLFLIAMVWGGAVGASEPRGFATPRPAATLTPPPLPFGDLARPLSSLRSVDPAGPAARLLPTTFVPYAGARPPIPKLSEMLQHRVRRTQSASGGTIVLTGSGSTAYLYDQTLPYGANVYWLCQNLTKSTAYKYVVFPPDGTAWTLSSPASVTTDASGNCPVTYAQVTLSTPLAAGKGTAFGGVATRSGTVDPAYAGVWAVAMQNVSTGLLDAVAYTVVVGTQTQNLVTYANAGFTTKANDFSSGSTVYVSGAGLNPAHFYAFGFVYTAAGGMPCIGAIPAVAQNFNKGTCFVGGASGTLPTNGTLSGSWVSPSAASATGTGTVSVQLYDTTTNDLITTQQISLNAPAIVWNAIVPYGSSGNGTNLNDTFATDGLLGLPGTGAAIVTEQSVSGVILQASGVTSGHKYSFTLSNGNGIVLSSTTGASTQQLSPPTQFTAASTSTGPQSVGFPINTTNFTAFGYGQTPFSPTVFTAQLYDVTAGAVVGSKSFTILSYAGQLQWTSPAGSYVNAAAAGAATNVTTTIVNTAGNIYGVANADTIAKVTITNDSTGFVSLGLQTGVTTTTDSAGQTWNLTNPNAQTVIATPAVAGQSLAVSGTLPIPLTVAVSGANCTTTCLLRTSILPLHGVVASLTDPTMTNRATNGLAVYGNGVAGASNQASYSWAVGAFSASATLPTPRYNQMMYRSGTNGASSGTYQVTLTVNNNGAAATLSALRFSLPATIDTNITTPTLVSATINGVVKTSNWAVYNDNGTNSATADATLAANAFALKTATAAAMIPIGKTGVFVLNVPLFGTSFSFQEIVATANYSGTAYAVSLTNTLTNAIAGIQNIDSTELGVFSLDPTLMSMAVTPSSIPTSAGTATLKYINTPKTGDPNPDYVSELLVTFPVGSVPTSIAVASPNQTGVTWYANPTGTAGQWLIELCTPYTATCTATADKNALPPGDELDLTLTYSGTQAAGSYPIAWSVRGANGDATVAAASAQQPTLTISNTTAQTSFTYAGGYTATPSYPPGAPIQAVAANGQPAVGSWADLVNGSAYVYELYNNGTTPITDVSITLPAASSGGTETDTQDWQLIASSIYTYGSGAAGSKCSANGYKTLTQPVRTGLVAGSLVLSGCSIAPGGTLDVFFNALSPYDVGSRFVFPAAVANNGTPGATNTLPKYANANSILVQADAKLIISIPGSGGTFSGLNGSSTPSVACAGCSYSTAGTYPLINLNSLSTTFTAQDVLAASVYSDTANGWNLYVSADVNPGTGSGQVSTWVSTTSTSATGFTRLVTTSPGTVIPTSGSPLAVSSYTGVSRRAPIDNIMGFVVTVSASPTPATTTVTLTYTLIAN